MENQSKTQKLHLTIRRLSADDLESAHVLASECFEDPWPRDRFAVDVENTNTSYYPAVFCDGVLAGYGGVWLIMKEAHVTAVVVNPQFRGKKIGKLLLWSLMKEAVEKGCRWAILEVNRQNEPALKIYRDFNFEEIGNRSGYYGPGLDAVVMWAKNIQGKKFSRILKKVRREWEQKICLSWE